MVNIQPVRYACPMDKGQSTYPLLDFIALIDHKAVHKDGSVETQEIKCTRNAAASIALACSETSYGQAKLLLSKLAGLELDVMTELRVTDSVGSEFVKEPPAEVDIGRIERLNKKISGNILEAKVSRMVHPENKDEVYKAIQKALKYGPEGVPHKDYKGPKIKVMYVMADGTGVPGRHQELAGAKGKQTDGTAKTFEAKVGAVFIVEYTADGKPLLTESGEIYRNKKVSYMGTIRKTGDFGPMLYQHAVENGLEDMDAVVFLGDGAKWLWNIQKEYFPNAISGIDLYHAIERLNSMIDFIRFNGRSGSDQKQAFKDKSIKLLKQGRVHDMLMQIEIMPCKKGSEKKLEGAIGYFRSNIERMNYGALAASGIFVGSGVIEAGCKVIVGNRMKQAGMHWSKDHAESMIALRCAVRNGNYLGSYLSNGASDSKKIA